MLTQPTAHLAGCNTLTKTRCLLLSFHMASSSRSTGCFPKSRPSFTFLPRAQKSKCTHNGLAAGLELAALSSNGNPDQSSDAFDAAVNAALRKNFGDLEARLETRFHAHVDARLNGLSGAYVTSAFFEAKLSAFDAFVGSRFAELNAYKHILDDIRVAAKEAIDRSQAPKHPSHR